MFLLCINSKVADWPVDFVDYSLNTIIAILSPCKYQVLASLCNCVNWFYSTFVEKSLR